MKNRNRNRNIHISEKECHEIIMFGVLGYLQSITESGYVLAHVSELEDDLNAIRFTQHCMAAIMDELGEKLISKDN